MNMDSETGSLGIDSGNKYIYDSGVVTYGFFFCPPQGRMHRITSLSQPLSGRSEWGIVYKADMTTRIYLT